MSATTPTSITLDATTAISLAQTIMGQFKNHSWTLSNLMSTARQIVTLVQDIAKDASTETHLAIITHVLTVLLEDSGLPGTVIAELITNIPLIISGGQLVLTELEKASIALIHLEQSCWARIRARWSSTTTH